MAVRLVISDLDGVLIDFHPARRLAYLESLTGLSGSTIHSSIWAGPFEPEAEAGAWPTGEAYLAEFNRRLGTAVTRADWVEARRRATAPRPDLVAYFASLAPRVRLAVLTNNGSLLRESLGELCPDVCAVFGDGIVASCELGARKPDPLVYRRLLARHGVEPADAVFIDDSAANVAGARAAGLPAIHFQSLGQLRQALTPLLP